MTKTKTPPEDLRFETLVVHAGMEPDPTTGAIITPIYQTSTYVQEDVAQHKGYEYSRTDNPTRTALQTALAILEEGKFGLAFASGMATTDTVLRLLKPGDHIVAGNDLYGGTHRLFTQVLAKTGLEFTFVDTSKPQDVENAMQANTELVWLETPTNPKLKLADISAIARIAHRGGARLAVDNTFASPALQRPLTLGADFVIHSTTKYIGGHSDMVGGAVVLNNEEVYAQLKFLQNGIGAIPGPMDCFLALRGMRTLALRMRTHCQNAQQIADYLLTHTAVKEVYYPGLDNHPQYELAKRQMAAPGGMVSFTLHAGEAAARLVALNTKLFSLAESLGGVESLIELPAPMTHASVANSPLAIDPGLVRLSVGVEHAEDLIEDLAQALATITREND